MTPAPYFTPAENARRVLRLLTEPWLLKAGEPLVDLDLIVAADFRNTSAGHAVTAHPSGLKVRNVRILFQADRWLPAWDGPYNAQPARGIPSGASGLCLAGTANADIDGLHVEGAPRMGIEGWDVRGLKLRRYSATRCNVGAHLAKRVTGNVGLDVDEVRVWDLWGSPSGIPSRLRPGGGVGGDGWVSDGNFVSLRRMEFSGEMFVGAKICRGARVQIHDLTTPALMLQGSSTPDPAEPGLSHLSIDGLYLNAATGYGLAADKANKVQCSFNVAGSIANGYLIGNGLDGNAIQMTGNCHLDIRGLTIGGFNGERGIGNPASALEINVAPGPAVSTINADFETANTFYNQTRIVHRWGAA